MLLPMLPDQDAGIEDLLEQGLTSTDWLQAGGITLGAIAAAIAANRVTRAIVSRSLGSGFGAIITARIIGYLIFLIGLLYALNTLGVRVGPLLGALGLSGLILALALQKVVENFVGALILQTRRPFTVGDTVQLGDQLGVIKDIDSRTVVMRGLDGSMIRVPNMEVLNSAIVTLTAEPARRSELQVGVAYDSNLEDTTRILGDAVARVPRVRDVPEPQILLRQFGASSIDFTVFYWHTSDIQSELAATHDLMLAVHHALADAGITIAFPQMVVWPGHDAVGNPYRDEPTQVYIGQPPEPPHPEASGPTPSKWSWRQRGAD